MTNDSRRQFLLSSMTGASAAWIAANWPAMAKAAEIAQGGDWGQFAYFTAAQAADIDAMAAQIFPTDDTPGAREAQAVYFIDLALTSFAKGQQAVMARGFVELDAKVSATFPGAHSFASLTSPQQIQLLTSIETTPFFRAVRDLTIMGMFAAPQHGGNFNKVGWKLIGFDDALNFHTPFGFYDR